MIEVNIDIDNNKIIKVIKVKGHSCFAEKGKDVICAAVSILIHSAYLSLLSIEVPIEYKDDKKSIRLRIKKIKQDAIGECRGISVFLIKGLKALSKEYKDNISIKLNLIKEINHGSS